MKKIIRQNEDDNGFFIGLGYILASMRFKVYIVKKADNTAGFQVRRKVYWSQKIPRLAMLPKIEYVLSIAAMVYEDEYTTSDHLNRIVQLVKKLDNEYNIRDCFVDQVGFHMLCWTIDNPHPQNYEEFIEWAEAFDDEEKMMEELDEI